MIIKLTKFYKGKTFATLFFVLFLILSFLFLILISYYLPLNGDEGVYLYQSQLVSKGFLPIRNFFATQPIIFYLFYSISQKILPGLQGGRLLSAVAYMAMLIMIMNIVKRELGKKYAVISGIMFLVNISFITRNIIVKHYAPANLFLLTSFYLLNISKKFNWNILILSGISFGFAINSRIILAPLLPIFLFYLISKNSKVHKASQKLLENRNLILFYIAGVLLASLPSIVLFINNPNGFILNLLGWRQYSYEPLDLYPQLINPLLSKTKQYIIFFLQSGLQNFFLLIPVFILIFSNNRKTLKKTGKWIGIIFLSIMIIYGFSDVLYSEYLNQVIPYLILLSIFSIKNLLQDNHIMHRWIFYWSIISICIVFYFINSYYFFTFRIQDTSQPSIKQLTNFRLVSDWIKTNTNPNEIILSWFAAPVADADRKLPTGMEQGYQTISFFCHINSINDLPINYFHILNCDNLRKQIISGKIGLIIDDDYSNLVVKSGFLDYRSLLQTYYSLVYSIDGYSIYRWK